MKLISTITFVLFFFGIQLHCTGQEKQTQKIVIAECNPFFNYSLNKTYLKGTDYTQILEENQTFKNGKFRTGIPLVSQLWLPLPMEDALAYEIQSAQKMGLNAFRFPFFVSNNKYYTEAFIKVVHKYLEVAEKRQLDFKFSIELIMKRPSKMAHHSYLEDAKYKLRQIFDNKIGNTKWLKDRNGDIMVFIKNPENIHPDFHANTKIKGGKVITPKLIEIKNYYKYLFEDVYGTFSLVYHNNFIKDTSFEKEVLKYFPSMYYPPFKQFRVKEMNRISQVCKKNKTSFIQPVYAHYFDSRLRKKSNQKYLGKNAKGEISTNDLYLNELPTHFTNDFRKTLDLAILRDAEMIDITSWNNFDDGTHISPELHTQYSLGELLKYKLSEWKKEDNKVREQCIVNQFKTLDKSTIEVQQIVNPFNQQPVDRSKIEVVTLLNESASLYVGTNYIKEVQAGLDYVLISSDSINGKINIVRNGKKIIQYKIPVLPVDTTPDALCYSSSSAQNELVSYYSYQLIYAEVMKNRARYLLDEKLLNNWNTIATLYAKAKIKLLEHYHFNASKYQKACLKEEKKYYASVKKLLSPMHYNIFIEMENDIKNGTLLAEEISFDEEMDFDNYNILQPE
ncbi:glycoside hydrolase family 71/99 protein [Flammeovirga aprica]|uniref:Uncharacterized protein n=1 Tax=Flammeovirga aprica JL-4 TaxID=694437 RepID=A0A7X9S0I0_9BACT|nr:hypothetical protein [Flammeovirga aprica]NME72096.1 hypothetical protein [Flammeovirga aprica JL-4]